MDEILLLEIGVDAAVVDLRENGQCQLEGNHLTHLDETVDDGAQEERRRLDVTVDSRRRIEEEIFVELNHLADAVVERQFGLRKTLYKGPHSSATQRATSRAGR